MTDTPNENATPGQEGGADQNNISSGNHTAIAVDLNAAHRFLGLLDEGAESFTFQTFTDTAKGERRPRPDPLAEIRHGTLTALAPWLTRQNERGAGVFVNVNATDLHGRKADNIVRVRAVWQEDDGEGKPLPLEPHIVVESSPGNHHRYLLVDGLGLCL